VGRDTKNLLEFPRLANKLSALGGRERVVCWGWRGEADASDDFELRFGGGRHDMRADREVGEKRVWGVSSGN
jgi:hypothetical protein